MADTTAQITIGIKDEASQKAKEVATAIKDLDAALAAADKSGNSAAAMLRVLDAANRVSETAFLADARAADGAARAIKDVGTAASGTASHVDAFGNGIKAMGGHLTDHLPHLGAFADGLHTLGTHAMNHAPHLGAFAEGLHTIGQKAQEHTPHVNLFAGGLLAVAKGALFGGALEIGRLAVHAFGGAMESAKDSTIGVDASLEQSALKFTALTGSSGTARAMMGQLEEVASHSTFGLQQIQAGAAQMLAFGVHAENVVPLMKAVQTAASAAGGDINDKFTRINYALAELNSGIPVSARQLRQLAMAGVPLDEIAKQLGITTEALYTAGKTGVVTGAQITQAFAAVYTTGRLGDFMEQQTMTFTGALAVIKTNVQLAGGAVMKPFFDIFRDGAVEIAKFVQSDEFNKWVTRLTAVTQVAADELRKFWAEIQRVGTELKHVEAAFAQGGIGGVFGKLITDAKDTVRGILDHFLGITPGMQDAGENLIVTYAKGIKNAISGTLHGAVNEVAQFIADFFVGHSPPPQGPLSRIMDGGEATMAAYVVGLKSGAGGASQVADALIASFNGVDLAVALPRGNEGLRAAGYSAASLKEAAAEVTDVVGTLDHALAGIGDTTDGIKFKIDDIKTGYEDAIEPLQKQLDLIKEQTNWEDKKSELLLKQDDLRLKQAEANDPILKGLKDQLALLEEQRKQAAVAPIDRSLERQLEQLQDELKGVKKGKEGDSQRATINGEIDALKEKIKTQKEGQTDATRALDSQILQIKNQIDAKDAVYKKDLDSNKIKQENLALDIQAKDIAKQLAELPLTQAIQEKKNAEKEALEPLQEQEKALNRQKAILTEQRREWQLLAKDIGDATKEIGKDPKAGAGAGGLDLNGKPLIDPGATAADHSLTGKFETMGKDFGKSLVGGVKDYLEKNWGSIIGGFFGGALGNVFGPVGVLAGAFVGRQFGGELQARLKDLGITLPGVMGGIRDALGGVGEYVKANVLPKLMAFGEYMMKQLPTIIATVEGFVKDSLIPALERLGKWIVEDGLPAFIRLEEFLWTKALPALLRLGAWVLDEGIPALVKFGGAVKEWIGDTLIPTIKRIWDENQPKLQLFAMWFTDTAIPAIKQFASGVKMFIEEQLIPAFRRIVTDVLPIVADLLAHVADVISQISDVIHKHGKGISETLQIAWTLIVAAVRIAVPAIAEYIKNMIAAADTFLTNVGHVKDYVVDNWDTIKGAFFMLKDTALDWKDRLIEFFGNVKDKVGEIHAWIVEKWDFVKTKFDEVKEKVLDWKDRLLEFLGNVKEKIGEVHQWIVEKWDFVKTKFDELKTKVETWKNDGIYYLDLFKDKIEMVRGWIVEKWDLVIGKFNDLRKTIETWKNDGSTFIDDIKTKFEELKTKGENFISPVANFFKDVVDRINDIKRPIDDLIGWIGKIHFPDAPSWLTDAGAVGKWIFGSGGGGSSGGYGGYTYGGTVVGGSTSPGYYGGVSAPYQGGDGKWHYLDGHTYADGGWINEHVVGVGMASGKSYQFGEAGPERIRNMKQEAALGGGGGGGTTIVVNVAGSITTARGLAEDVKTELLRMKRQGIPLGLA